MASYPYILAGLGTAMVLSLVFILLLRCFAGPIVWISILVVLAACGAGQYWNPPLSRARCCATLLYVLQDSFALHLATVLFVLAGIYFCYAYWNQLKDGGASVPDWADVPPELRSWLDDPLTWMVLMIVLAVVLAVLLLMVLFLRKRISLAVTLIEQGGKAVSSTTSTLFFPILPWALQVAAVAYALSVLLYLATLGQAMYKTHGLENCVCTGLPLLQVCVVCRRGTSLFVRSRKTLEMICWNWKG